MAKETTSPSSIQEFFKDRPALLVAALAVVGMLVNTISVLARLRSHTFKVPIQYSTLDGSVIQADWFHLYGIAVFTLVTGIMTIVIAYRLHKGNRWYAIATLLIYLIVATLSFLSINALLGFVSQI